jgi:histone deacetylase 6
MAQRSPSDQGETSRSTAVPQFASFIPQLRDPPLLAGDVSMRETPDMSRDISNRLNLETPSDDESVDSFMTDTDSDPDDAPAKPVPGLPLSTLPTGLCYDDRMRYHAEVAATSAENVHPEDPRRIYYIYKELCEAGLVEDKRYPLIVDQPLHRILAREATPQEILLVHEDFQLDFVQSTQCEYFFTSANVVQASTDQECVAHPVLSNADLVDLSERPDQDSIYYNQMSFFAGKLSAGAAIETCKAVLSQEVKNAIAVIRPPGHHAEPEKPMGFCLFNNVCVASKACQLDPTLGANCRKILIVDWYVLSV